MNGAYIANMQTRLLDYFNTIDIIRRGAVFNFVNSNRNYGKTWGFKIRALKRALKNGKKTIWVRRFEKEVKKACSNFFPRDLLDMVSNASIWSKSNPKGNIKHNGRIWYVKYKGEWRWFLMIVKASDADAMRSADDIDVDTLIFDEYLCTPSAQHRYRGNVCSDIMDTFISLKRNHNVKCFFLGNKQKPINEFFGYLGIKNNFREGIYLYKNGSVCVQTINNPPREVNNYDKKVNALLSGTPYGRYLHGEILNAAKYKRGYAPRGAYLWAQIDIDGNAVRIRSDGTFFYVDTQIDKSKVVYCNTDKYMHTRRLTQKTKPLFDGYKTLYSYGYIRYADDKSFAAIQPFDNWIFGRLV